MKKILIATTALVAFAGAAHAAEPIKLTVGGYAEQWVGYADNEDGAINAGTTPGPRSKVDVQGDNEIHFKGSTKLDNGLTVAFTYEHEIDGSLSTKNGSNPASDEVYITVSGGFGAVIVGQQDNVGEIIHNKAPDVGISLSDGDYDNWIVRPTGHNGYDGTYANHDQDADKIIYVTPAFAGLQAGFSYTPDINTARVGDTGVQSTSTPVTTAINGAGTYNPYTGDLYVGGFAYANKFGDVAVKADLGAALANVQASPTVGTDLRIYQGGVAVTYAGFTVGGSYLKRDVRDNAAALKDAGRDGSSWDAGVSYTTGPYAVSVAYYHDSSADAVGAGTQDDETAVWMLSGSYAMGPGVALKGSVFRAEYDNEGTAATNPDNEGWGVVTGLRLDF